GRQSTPIEKLSEVAGSRSVFAPVRCRNWTKDVLVPSGLPLASYRSICWLLVNPAPVGPNSSYSVGAVNDSEKLARTAKVSSKGCQRSVNFGTVGFSRERS